LAKAYDDSMPSWSIARMEPCHAERVRAVRLRALADSPDAFGTTYAEDAERPRADWRDWIGTDAKAVFVATDVEGDVGLAVGKTYDAGPTGPSPKFRGGSDDCPVHRTRGERPEDDGLARPACAELLGRSTGDAGLFAMWVAPASRGKGIGRALVGAVVQWARSRGYRRVLLDVADENAHAVRLYERCGFVPTGERGLLPAPREHVLEHQRALAL